MDLTDRSSFEEATGRFFSSFKGVKPLLVSDYDGTLAPFRKERDEATPLPPVRRALRAILDAGGDLVILSGRRATEVASLLNLPVEVWGCHGCEKLGVDGVLERPTLLREDSLALESMARELSKFPTGAVERKPVSVALHWRGRESVKDAYDEVSAHLALEAGRAGLEVLPFNGGIEYRLSRCTKGRAMERILMERKRGTPVCYLGDDVTDEDAFRVLRGRGLGVLVAGRSVGTAAELRIDPDNVEAFLHLWRYALTRSGAERG
ncbi:MAG: trehalose-phosphatase [Synergistaceae bacterium]|nr:trehalose-phosphatase [Synergistaceae bacterium]